MLPCDASLARREGSNMSLGMARVPRQETAVMLQRVYDCYSSNGVGPVLLAHSRSIPRTTYQTGEADTTLGAGDVTGDAGADSGTEDVTDYAGMDPGAGNVISDASTELEAGDVRRLERGTFQAKRAHSL